MGSARAAALRRFGFAACALVAGCGGGGSTPNTAVAPGPRSGAGAPAAPTASPSAAPTSVASNGATLALSVDSAYLDQSAQTYAGTVPIVAGRDGWLRVFVKANEPNTALPAVRVRWYAGSTPIRTDVLPPPSGLGGVPTSIDEGNWNASWNERIPASFVTPGLAMLVDVDPNATVAQTTRAGDVYPRSGVPLVLSVVSLAGFGVTMIPVTTPNGAPNVSAANALATYLDAVEREDPIPALGLGITIGTPLVESIAPTATGTNWSTILADLAVKHVAEGGAGWYDGIVHVPYSSGVAGVGYEPGRENLSWDNGGADAVVVHEMGHNFGLSHAPCGNPPGVDPAWPSDPAHANGAIGIWGLDMGLAGSGLGTGPPRLIPPTGTDYMGYCSPDWISDHNYENLVRNMPQLGASAAAAAVAPSALLVVGRIAGGHAVVDAAYRTAASTVPPAPGPYRIEGFAADGRRLFAVPFAGSEVDLGSERGFAFAVPVEPGTPVANLTVTEPDGTRFVRQAPPPPGAAQAPALASQRTSLGNTRFAWDARRFPVAMVRDAATGTVLGFLRGGSGAIAAPGRDVDVVLSNGVDSTTERVRAR